MLSRLRNPNLFTWFRLRTDIPSVFLAIQGNLYLLAFKMLTTVYLSRHLTGNIFVSKGSISLLSFGLYPDSSQKCTGIGQEERDTCCSKEYFRKQEENLLLWA